MGGRKEKEWSTRGNRKQELPISSAVQSVGEKAAFTGKRQSRSRVLRGLSPFGERNVQRRLRFPCDGA